MDRKLKDIQKRLRSIRNRTMDKDIVSDIRKVEKMIGDLKGER